MIYAFKERIGDPSLFCGRKQQMELLMNWVKMIPRQMAKSRALLCRRKSGKSAVMQRLFNLLWNQNGSVIPFYFEVREEDQWLLSFSEAYYRTFMSHYLSFKTRTALPFNNRPWQFVELIKMATEIGDKNVLKDIGYFQAHMQAEQVEQAMNWAFGAPADFAELENVFILVMIDEIQFMTKYIFYDKEHKVSGRHLPGAYHGLVESKVAPMLVSGSYVGWMTQMIHDKFKGGRLKKTKMSSKLAEDEGLEAVYRYAEYNNKPVSDEVALLINKLLQSDPFYIASLFRSDWEEQDFSSVEGVIKTLDYEIKDRDGEIFGTWAEYIYSTIQAVNDRYAKQILLFLSKERHKECTRTEISDHLKGELSDSTLEKKLRILESGDLITQGSNNFRYSGIPDDILDLIFRTLYQEEIEQVEPDIAQELTNQVIALKKDKQSLQGAYNELKGRMLELIVYRELNQCRNKGKPIDNFRARLRAIEKAQMEATLTAVSKLRFERVWMNYYIQLPQTTGVEVDVLALGEDKNSCWALVFELKNRDAKHLPTQVEAQLFVTKIDGVKQWLASRGKTIKLVCPVYLSAEGFADSVETWLHEQGVLTSDLAHWERGSK